MTARWWPLLLVTAALGCGSDTRTPSTAASTTSLPATATRTVPIVGAWRTLRTCQGLLEALRRADLRPLAPVVVDDYFPGQTPRQLARKTDVCGGARPRQHSHFFTDDGHFGSLDEHGQQVDDGRYRADARTIRIGNPDTRATFHYHVAGGRNLTLEPLISRRMRRRALAHPLRFSAAGWAVAVAYTGHTWTRVGSARG
jgi:hypothetical protein